MAVPLSKGSQRASCVITGFSMRRMTSWKVGLAGLALWLGAAPIASAAEVVVRTGPREAPPEIREEPPPARRGYVWDGTHYEWRHGRYVRVRGHYVRERRNAEWVPGHWEHREDRYQYHRSEWHPRR